jgi:hypothetical protein
MNTTAQRTRSVWMADLPRSYPALASMETDIAVVGAGLAGLTTCWPRLDTGWSWWTAVPRVVE